MVVKLDIRFLQLCKVTVARLVGGPRDLCDDKSAHDERCGYQEKPSNEGHKKTLRILTLRRHCDAYWT